MFSTTVCNFSNLFSSRWYGYFWNTLYMKTSTCHLQNRYTWKCTPMMNIWINVGTIMNNITRLFGYRSEHYIIFYLNRSSAPFTFLAIYQSNFSSMKQMSHIWSVFSNLHHRVRSKKTLKIRILCMPVDQRIFISRSVSYHRRTRQTPELQKKIIIIK